MDAATLAGVAARRSAMYWLLADLFLTCPNEILVVRLRRDFIGVQKTAAGDSLATSLSALRDALPEVKDAAGITKLAVEYTRLFGAINASYGLPPPYESVHRSAGEAAALAVAVSEYYSAAGLAPTDQASPPDHIGVELKFVALSCHSEREAWQQDRAAEAIQALGRQRTFLDDHLLRWAPGYWELVQAKAQHEFFRQLATLARRSVTADRALIEEILVELDAA